MTTPMSPEQERFLQDARTLALHRMPYMASILFGFRPVNAPGLGTYACDQWMRLYVDFEAVMPLGVRHASQALLHECMHILRADYRLAEETRADRLADAKALNAAADAANDDDLRDAGCEIFAEQNPYGHILPSSLGAPDHQTAHDYFRHIKSLQQKAGGSGQGQQGQGQQGQGQQGQGQQWQGQQGQGQGQGQQQGGAPYRGCGSGAGNPWGGELPQGDDLGGAAPAASGTEVEQHRIATAAAIRDSARKGIGKVPGGLVATAEFVLAPPKVDWRRVLSKLIRGATRARAGLGVETYSRRKARWHDFRVFRADEGVFGDRIVLPGTQTPTPNIVVIRDTSGSMGNDEIAAVLAEVEGIAARVGVRGDGLRVIDFDTKAYETRDYRRADDLSTVHGGGGTDMAAAVIYALDLKPKPDVVVVITDGYTGWPSERPRTRIPVIAGIVGRREDAERQARVVPDWIRALPIELEGER